MICVQNTPVLRFASDRTYANQRRVVEVLLFALIVLIFSPMRSSAIGEVIWAVNSGGGQHVDIHGVHYQKDSLGVGFSSDHGKNIGIRRVANPDQILYQTERYHTDNFAYNVPIKADGEYVLVLKFSEVWFNEPNQKVFDVQLNDEIKVVDHLDIFSVAGLGVAHDEIIPFTVRNGQISVRDESTSFEGTLKIEFVKLNRDNPKINAMYVMRGKYEDVPQLPPLPRVDYPSDQEEEEEEEPSSPSSDQQRTKPERRRKASTEPKVIDPYAAEDPSSMMIPVIVAIGAFIPLVFCLCKL